MSFLQNLPNFPMFQKNYEGILEIYIKRALKWCISFYNSMKLKSLKVVLNVAQKRFKKYKYSRLGASQSQNLPPTECPPTFYTNLRS